MAGKNSKGKNRRGNSATTTSSSAEVVAASSGAPLNESSGDPLNDLSIPEAVEVDANENASGVEPVTAEGEEKEPEVNQGGVHLYPVSVKALGGEKLELQLNPGDSILDIRQFLLDAPETCFITCYDLLLQTKDGSIHHLEDHYEISEVADITTGGCSLEMVAELYDDRAIRAHVNRTRNLLSLSSLHASLSTSLALQFTTAQKKASTAGDTAKSDSPCLDGLGFMEDVTASLSNLISSSSKEIKSVESIVFSSFNPPPSHRRLVGDLIYLDVVTLEGNIYCITGTTKTFYVNSSHGSILDPKPNKATPEATTLIGLLQKLSPKFKKAFRDILDGKAAAHPFENVQSLLPPNKWLGRHPVPDHKRDAARAEDALTLSYGSELIGMQRDWNEELQSCREFPHTTPQERILRDRALYKVTSDFVDAAINGATGVISRCIPPINPTDPECFHMYVHNNIFFSFAVDSDLEQLSKKRLHNSETESASSLQNSSEKASNGINSDGTVAGDSDVAAETQLVDSEQATYASANNDLKGTKSYQEADVSGLYNLAMAIIDYRGHRVVAQSVLPGILQGDKSDSLLYGSVDNGKKICWNEDFHSKVLEAAKRLHLKEHMVLDGSGNSFKLAAPVECKGIVGSDDRHYLLDLMRVTPRDANYTGPGSRFYILRSELITAYCQAKSLEGSTCCTNGGDSNVSPNEVSNNDEAEKTEAAASASSNCEDTTSKSKAETTPESVSEPAQCPESQKELLFNPNVFTDFKLAGSPEDIAADEENVRKVSSYLINVVLPKFIQDLCTLEVSPMDGQTFSEALHAHGINVRYIGNVADGTKHLPHLWDLCTNEIVVRCAKHILKDVLRETEDHELAPSIAHFLNCFFGSYQVTGTRVSANSSQSKTHKKQDHQSSGKSSKGLTKLKGGASARKSLSSFMNLSSETLWCNIQEFAKLKYQFELPDDARPRVKKVSVMRNLCQKVGITIAARKYDLEATAPFQTSDILDLQPVVKHSVPVCSEAKDLVETGKEQLAEGMLGEAYTLFSEAFSILQQVTGPMHREVANCCRYLAMVLYHAGDMESAIIQQHKELIINECCLGLDHPDTAHSYGNMSLFYHGLNQTELALQHMSRALLLLSLSSGPDHPDVAATYINVAMMYQDIGKMDTALRYLQEALTKNERLLGEEHIQTAVCYHALAIAFNCMGAFKLSHQHEKKTYDILVKQVGEEDSRTRDSENWMKTFKNREEHMIVQKQKGQAVNSAPAQNPIELLKAHPNLMQALQAVAGRSSASVNKSLNAAIIGEALPRGRGVDERAARATADARKKAAGRGYVKPQPDVPVQPLSQINQQILNMVSAMTPDAVSNKEANGLPSNSNGITTAAAAAVEKKEPQAASGQDQPAGLGKGLGSLDSKKHKGKPKVAG